MPSHNFQQIIPFKGTSMTPLIKEGDKVVVNLYSKPIPLSKKLNGDLCFYNDGDEWVTHRVLVYENDLYIKGDFAKSFEIDSGLNIWGQVVQVQTSKGKIIDLQCCTRYNFLCSKLSAVHMVKKGFMGKVSKLLLYGLNTFKRTF